MNKDEIYIDLDFGEAVYVKAQSAEAAASSAEKADKDEIDLLKKFIDYNNYEVSESHDSVTDTQYQVIRIYQTKLDGTKQYPFVVCPNGTEKATYSASTLNHEKEYLLAINAGIFDMSTLKPDGVVVENGKVIQDSVSATHSKCMPLTIDARGNLSYTAYDKTAASMISEGIVSAVCGFMPIITDYEKFDSSKWNSVDHYTEAAQRQIIGQYGNGDYCIITSEGRNFDNSVGWTIAQAQDICQGLGLKFAYNLDGGGSVETMLMKRQANIVYEGKSGRVCPTFICFNGDDNFDGTQTEISPYSYITSVHFPKAAYIDTGVVPTAKTSASYSYSVTEWGESVNSGHILSTTNFYFPFVRKAGDGQLNRCGNQAQMSDPKDSNGSVWTWASNYGTGKIATFDAFLSETNAVRINGNNVKKFVKENTSTEVTPTPGSISPSTNLLIAKYPGRTDLDIAADVYYVKIYEGSTLIRDFVPVMRKSDSVYGMLDQVTGKFYASASTTACTASV